MHLITLLLLGTPLLQLLAGSENTAGQKRKAPSGCGLSSIDDSESRAEIAQLMLKLKTFRSDDVDTTCNEANKKASSSINFIDAENSDVPSSLDVPSDYLDEDIVGSEDISSDVKCSNSETENNHGHFPGSSDKEIFGQGEPSIQLLHGIIEPEENMDLDAILVKMLACPYDTARVYTNSDRNRFESPYRNTNKINVFVSDLMGANSDLIAYFVVRSLKDRKYNFFDGLLKEFDIVPVRPIVMAFKRLQSRRTQLIKPLSTLIAYRPEKFVDVVYFIITSPGSDGLKVPSTLKKATFNDSVYAAILKRALEIKNAGLILQLDSVNLLKVPDNRITDYFLVLYELQMHKNISKLIRQRLSGMENQSKRNTFVNNLIVRGKIIALDYATSRQNLEVSEREYNIICKHMNFLRYQH